MNVNMQTRFIINRDSMKSTYLFYILIAVSLYCTIIISWYQLHIASFTHRTSDHNDAPNFRKNMIEEKQTSHALLSCGAYGGPDDEVAQQMVYWSDIPTDAKFKSPLKKSNRVQYLTFEPDMAGFNNRRMSLETVFILAYSMGRTLVLPPSQIMYMLEGKENNQKIHFSFADFFHLDLIDREHDGFDIISMEQYLTREAGNFRDKVTREISYPPGNRTNWDGENPEPLELWLRSVNFTPLWDSDQCVLLMPSHDDSNITYIQEIHQALRSQQRDDTFMTPVNASLNDRMAEMLIGRDLCVYEKAVQDERSVHLKCTYEPPEPVRFLVHFYAFIMFEDWRQQMWAHRFVRDHLRYMDEIQCAAARIVDALQRRSRERNSGDNGHFDSFHVRRGDFQYQYKDMIVNASVLYDGCKDVIPPNATVYVATDEKDKAYFEPLARHYDLVYLDDFLPLVQGLNTNYFGMLDQLITSKSRYFFGTFYSTFSGYINRLRGYQSTKNQLEGYTEGTTQSYYFHPEYFKDVMRHYAPIQQPLWSREFPVSWRDIDRGISESF